MSDLSWLWDKYTEPPKGGQAEAHIMRQDIFYLKGIIEGMKMVMEVQKK